MSASTNTTNRQHQGGQEEHDMGCLGCTSGSHSNNGSNQDTGSTTFQRSSTCSNVWFYMCEGLLVTCVCTLLVLLLLQVPLAYMKPPYTSNVNYKVEQMVVMQEALLPPQLTAAAFYNQTLGAITNGTEVTMKPPLPTTFATSNFNRSIGDQPKYNGSPFGYRPSTVPPPPPPPAKSG